MKKIKDYTLKVLNSHLKRLEAKETITHEEYEIYQAIKKHIISRKLAKNPLYSPTRAEMCLTMKTSMMFFKIKE